MSGTSAPAIFFYAKIEWDGEPGASMAGLPKEMQGSAK